MEAKFEVSGFLRKRGSKWPHTWRRRWFRLSPRQVWVNGDPTAPPTLEKRLSYYVSNADESRAPKGAVTIKGIRTDGVDDKTYTISFLVEGGAELLARAESRAEQLKWVHALETCEFPQYRQSPAVKWSPPLKNAHGLGRKEHAGSECSSPAVSLSTTLTGTSTSSSCTLSGELSNSPPWRWVQRELSWSLGLSLPASEDILPDTSPAPRQPSPEPPQPVAGLVAPPVTPTVADTVAPDKAPTVAGVYGPSPLVTLSSLSSAKLRESLSSLSNADCTSPHSPWVSRQPPATTATGSATDPTCSRRSGASVGTSVSSRGNQPDDESQESEDCPWIGRQLHSTMHRGERRSSVPSFSNPTFNDVATPPSYIVAAYDYTSEPAVASLPKALCEARDVAAAAMQTLRLDNPSLDELETHLSHAMGLHLVSHGDAPLHGERVPLVASTDGTLLAVSIARWVATIAPHAQTGRLRFVYLGACRSHALGRALRDAGVECVVASRTLMHDDAAARFGAAFVSALATGNDGGAAFDAAARALLGVEEAGMLDTGMKARVQKYAMIDPCDASIVHQSGSHRGRMRPTAEMTRRGVPTGWRGRLAAGVPELVL